MAKVKHMLKKMLVIGDPAVGKTSLIRRFVHDRFDDDYITTIGTKTSAKALHIRMTKEYVDLKLQIWDILGQKGYSRLQHSSFLGTHGVFIVADVTRKKTLLSIKNYWIPKVQYIVGKIPFIILANKNDLVKNAEFTKEELREFASEYNVPFYLTSAKTGNNVNLAFNTIVKRMIEFNSTTAPKPKKSIVIHPRLLYEGDKSKITQLIDRIIDDFCREYGGHEDAMPVIRKQFELAKLNLNNPTLEALKDAIDRLAKIEMDFIRKDIAEANRTKRLNWIQESKVN
ncbi:MAG: GTP-binding protein [Methanomassiliicoccales archaeon]|nr:MAG: GTP-binding protein [Methanomassiliicoccales archaeon]